MNAQNNPTKLDKDTDARARRLAVANMLEETAKKVILPRFRALSSGDVREKKPGDLVTIADEEAELMLSQSLTSLWPGSKILGEEGVAGDATRLSLAYENTPLWIIDPIDGTSNFVAGREHFAVIIALAVDGMITEGWIYQPMAERMIYAKRGQGAWSLTNAGWQDSSLLDFDRNPNLRDMDAKSAIGTAYGQRKPPPDHADHQDFERSLSEYLRKSGKIGTLMPQNSSGTEYISLALGELHWSLHSRSLPWDHAAGMLITAEAGGMASTLEGHDYDWRKTEQNPLASVNQRLLSDVRAAVQIS
ncbi:MAG: inositol monophosphatase [Alphaproteobacteria bacterium]|nr:inositol monophosphatase [Alphaproteobacteria bacterium]